MQHAGHEEGSQHEVVCPERCDEKIEESPDLQEQRLRTRHDQNH